MTENGLTEHNCIPYTLIVIKLLTQTLHESRVCSINFEVKDQGHSALITERNFLLMTDLHFSSLNFSHGILIINDVYYRFVGRKV